jgi:hypothetical protein
LFFRTERCSDRVGAKNMWQDHLTVLAVLAALAVPVYVLDHFMLRPQGHMFLIDLTGLFIAFYALWLAVHIPVSSLALCFFNTDRVYTLHGLTAVVSVGLVVLGYAVVTHVDAARSKAKHEARMTMRQALFDTITLEKWWYVPDAARPEAIGAVFVVDHSGRLAASVHGRTSDPYGGGVFHGEMRPQKQVEAGERVESVFPLKYYSDDPAPDVAFSFMLFRDSTGSAPVNVFKEYVATPERADDGERFYDTLPPPVASPSVAPDSETRR